MGGNQALGTLPPSAGAKEGDKSLEYPQALPVSDALCCGNLQNVKYVKKAGLRQD